MLIAASVTPPFFSSEVEHSRRFFLDLAPPADTSLAVVCGGYEECSKNYHILREMFPYYSIEVVTRGEGWVRLNGKRFKLRPGSVFTYGPGVRHEIHSSANARLVKYFVDFCGIQAGQVLRNAELDVGVCVTVSPVAELQIVLNELLRDGARKDNLSNPLCEAWLKSLTLRVAAHRAELGKGRNDSFSTYKRCINYIDSNVDRLTSQSQIATECDLAPGYLCRLFKKHGRQSPYQYLTRARMNRAAELLLDTTLAVGEVADKLGFADPFHFSRTFKASYGVSPTAFRNLR